MRQKETARDKSLREDCVIHRSQQLMNGARCGAAMAYAALRLHAQIARLRALVVRVRPRRLSAPLFLVNPY